MTEIPCVWEVEPRLKLYEAVPHKINTPLRNPQDVVEFIKNYAADLAAETMLVFNLDSRGNVINFSRATTGTLVMTPCTAREVFKSAILSNAAMIIAAHNHPSGDPEPSSMDIDMTNKLIRCGQLMDIPLLDHIIIGAENGKVFSFLANQTEMFDKATAEAKKEFPNAE